MTTEKSDSKKPNGKDDGEKQGFWASLGTTGITLIALIGVVWFGWYVHTKPRSAATEPRIEAQIASGAQYGTICPSDGSQILEGQGPFRAMPGRKTLWINIIGRWIHIVPGNGAFSYDLQDSNGTVRSFKCKSGIFYEVLPDTTLKRLDDQSGTLWRQAVFERFQPEEEVTFTVDRQP